MLNNNQHVAELQFHCPHTGRSINTGVQADYQGLAKVWENTMQMRCPHCGMDHDIKIRDVFLDQFLRADRR